MRITIIGASAFGRATAQTLIDHGHGVIVIDRDRKRLDALAETIDCGMIQGDGSSPATLREAWQDKKDVLIALTNSSDDNVLAALVGRSVGYGRVIPQILSRDLLEVCAELELTDTILPHDTVARSLSRAIEEHADVSENLTLSEDLRLKRVDVPESAEGQTLGDLDFPKDVRAVAIIRGSEESFADPDFKLACGDEILCVASVKKAKNLAQHLF